MPRAGDASYLPEDETAGKTTTQSGRCYYMASEKWCMILKVVDYNLLLKRGWIYAGITECEL